MKLNTSDEAKQDLILTVKDKDGNVRTSNLGHSKRSHKAHKQDSKAYDGRLWQSEPYTGWRWKGSGYVDNDPG